MSEEHISQIDFIAKNDCAMLRHKESTYGGSWKKRGGVGAFMMLARKMDRIENIAAKNGYDIFAVIQREGLLGSDGDLIAEIRDLRGYLLLVEAEMFTRELTQAGSAGACGTVQPLLGERTQESVRTINSLFTGGQITRKMCSRNGGTETNNEGT
jgi:hypothetical protein